MPLLSYLQILFLSLLLPCSFYCLYCLSWDSSSGQGLPHGSDPCNALPSVAAVLLSHSRQQKPHMHPSTIKLMSSTLQTEVSDSQWTLLPGGAGKQAICNVPSDYLAGAFPSCCQLGMGLGVHFQDHLMGAPSQPNNHTKFQRAVQLLSSWKQL